MSIRKDIWGIIGTTKAVVVWVGAVVSTLALLGHPLAAAVLVLALGLLYFWMALSYFHYRHGRQDELLHVLTTTVEAKAPLAPALWAYLDDRPRGPWRETWVFLMLLFVVPGYYWFWHRRHSFDHKVAQVAARLERGYALSDALGEVHGVLPRETVLAAEVGEATDRLPHCLRNTSHARLAAVWAELLPRLAYPFLLLFVIVVILTFWSVYLLPRFERVFQDFGMALPPATQQVIEVSGVVADSIFLIGLAFLTLLGAALLLLCSSSLRWYLPGIGRLYRMHVQSRVLRLLAILIEVQKPVPQALQLLVASGYGSRIVRRRLGAVLDHVEKGDPLPATLYRQGLLPRSMLPLVQSAERLGNLPWALGELAEVRGNLLVRLLRQASILLSPVIIVLMGLLVCGIAMGMFLPLVTILMGLS